MCTNSSKTGEEQCCECDDCECKEKANGKVSSLDDDIPGEVIVFTYKDKEILIKKTDDGNIYIDTEAIAEAFTKTTKDWLKEDKEIIGLAALMQNTALPKYGYTIVAQQRALTLKEIVRPYMKWLDAEFANEIENIML